MKSKYENGRPALGPGGRFNPAIEVFDAVDGRPWDGMSELTRLVEGFLERHPGLRDSTFAALVVEVDLFTWKPDDPVNGPARVLTSIVPVEPVHSEKIGAMTWPADCKERLRDHFNDPRRSAVLFCTCPEALSALPAVLEGRLKNLKEDVANEAGRILAKAAGTPWMEANYAYLEDMADEIAAL